MRLLQKIVNCCSQPVGHVVKCDEGCLAEDRALLLTCCWSHNGMKYDETVSARQKNGCCSSQAFGQDVTHEIAEEWDIVTHKLLVM